MFISWIAGSTEPSQGAAPRHGEAEKEGSYTHSHSKGERHEGSGSADRDSRATVETKTPHGHAARGASHVPFAGVYLPIVSAFPSALLHPIATRPWALMASSKSSMRNWSP
jgi:hypothetical protein